MYHLCKESHLNVILLLELYFYGSYQTVPTHNGSDNLT